MQGGQRRYSRRDTRGSWLDVHAHGCGSGRGVWAIFRGHGVQLQLRADTWQLGIAST